MEENLSIDIRLTNGEVAGVDIPGISHAGGKPKRLADMPDEYLEELFRKVMANPSSVPRAQSGRLSTQSAIAIHP